MKVQVSLLPSWDQRGLALQGKGIPCRAASTSRLQGESDGGRGVFREKVGLDFGCTWQSGARWVEPGEVKALSIRLNHEEAAQQRQWEPL